VELIKEDGMFEEKEETHDWYITKENVKNLIDVLGLNNYID